MMQSEFMQFLLAQAAMELNTALWESIYPRIKGVNPEALKIWAEDIENQKRGSIEPFRDILDCLGISEGLQYSAVEAIFYMAILKNEIDGMEYREKVLIKSMVHMVLD